MKSRRKKPIDIIEITPDDYDYFLKLGFTKALLDKILNETPEPSEEGIAEGLKEIEDNNHVRTYGSISQPGIDNTRIKRGKKYLDSDKTIPRISYDVTGDILFMNEGEYLTDVIDCLPSGPIDKQATGIGATTLEMQSSRNSIIVFPARVLAQSKAEIENRIQRKEACLYVGTKRGSKQSGTPKDEINAYLDNTGIQHKKLLVVADSLEKVIEVFEKRGEDVYTDYFLMVDEIDVLQSDSNFRKSLEDVIDYYLKFKRQRRCLISATIREFSHPSLVEEVNLRYLTIKYTSTPKRTIDLIHTDNIYLSVKEKIEENLSVNSNDKILIAYNSVIGILKIINLLDKEMQQHCGVLCSEASKKEVGHYHTEISPDDNTLKSQITFMTCAYFTGIDIKGEDIHLITVSDINKAYAVLPLNKITQIHGRCRNGVISDTIIYSTHTDSFYYDIKQYRDELINKAQKIINLLKSIDEMIGKEEEKNSIKKLFDRIKHLIVEKADERLFSNAIYKLTREHVFDKSPQIAYFNIDALCEKMEAYSKLYSHEKGLHDALLEQKHKIKSYSKEFLDVSLQQKEKEKQVDERARKMEREQLEEAKDTVIKLYNAGVLEHEIKALKRYSKRNVKLFYERVQKHYQYINISTLCSGLLEISDQNTKAYRNLNNAISFHILDKKHPFKIQLKNAFKTEIKYTSQEIADILNPILYRYFHKKISTSEAVSFLKSIYKTKRNFHPQTLMIEKNKINPYKLPKPLKTIPEHELELEHKHKVSLHKFFEIVMYEKP